MKFADIIENAKKIKAKKLAVIAAEDEDVLFSVVKAASFGFVKPLLLGNTNKITELAKKAEINLNGCELVHADNQAEAARLGVVMAAEGKVDALMKGQLHSSILMRAILNKEWGIRESKVLSHVGIIESPKLNRLLFLTDGAMCMYISIRK